MIVKAIIINIEKINNVNMVSVLFCEKEDDNSDFQYTLQIVTEDSVIDALKAGRVTLDNAKVDGGKLKGITGDLKRFAGEHKPVVILAEMHQEKQGLIGYRVSLSNGTVRRVKLKEMLAYAKRKTDANQIPFQNGIYVRETDEKKEFIKAYKSSGFDVDVITARKNKHAAPANINMKSNEKAISKLDELFTKEQQAELRKGKLAGVDIRIYGNNKLSAEQMAVIRQGLEERLPMKLVADPEYSVQSMKMYMADMKYGYDVTGYLNPKYTAEQIMEVSIGITEGVDVSKYADPSNTPERMAETRLRLEHDIWKEEHALPNGKWI